jgi:DNA-binding HxlR family transcriptional regulator
MSRRRLPTRIAIAIGGKIISAENNAACPITDLLDVLSAKWVVGILRELAIKPTRTTAFLTHIPGLSMKVLRERLMMLEVKGFVTRTETDGRPVKVEYAITQRGRRLFYLLMEIKLLSDEWSGTGCHCSFENACGSEASLDCHRRRARVRSYQSPA